MSLLIGPGGLRKPCVRHACLRAPCVAWPLLLPSFSLSSFFLFFLRILLLTHFGESPTMVNLIWSSPSERILWWQIWKLFRPSLRMVTNVTIWKLGLKKYELRKKCFHIQMVTGMNLFQMVTFSNGDIFNLKWIVRIISNGDMFKWWHIEYDVNKNNCFKWWHIQFEMNNKNYFKKLFIPLQVWIKKFLFGKS